MATRCRGPEVANVCAEVQGLDLPPLDGCGVVLRGGPLILSLGNAATHNLATVEVGDEAVV
jgi:hypothetical protein